MPKLNKFYIGVIVTALIGWFFHAGLRYGDRFVDQLDSGSQKAIAQAAGLTGVTARFERAGPLARVAHLSGPQLDASERDRIRMSILAATPGLFDARWEKDSAVPTIVAQDNDVAASPEAVALCQSRVDAVQTGKAIEFLNGSSSLAEGSGVVLAAVAASIGPCPNMRVSVIGHADASGSTARNMRLSEERANVVVEALISLGIPATRLLPQGMGETQPLERAVTPQAYARNRRIEFEVKAKPSLRKS
jgi:outer membrane protein OmpA-like peptidoglycan-associated protein